EAVPPTLHNLTGQPACRDADEDEPQELHADDPSELVVTTRPARLLGEPRPAGVGCDPPGRRCPVEGPPYCLDGILSSGCRFACDDTFAARLNGPSSTIRLRSTDGEGFQCVVLPRDACGDDRSRSLYRRRAKKGFNGVARRGLIESGLSPGDGRGSNCFWESAAVGRPRLDSGPGPGAGSARNCRPAIGRRRSGSSPGGR